MAVASKHHDFVINLKQFQAVREPESAEKKSGKQRRRYTLDQIEREEFKETDSELQISEPEVGRCALFVSLSLPSIKRYCF